MAQRHIVITGVGILHERVVQFWKKTHDRLRVQHLGICLDDGMLLLRVSLGIVSSSRRHIVLYHSTSPTLKVPVGCVTSKRAHAATTQTCSQQLVILFCLRRGWTSPMALQQMCTSLSWWFAQQFQRVLCIFRVACFRNAFGIGCVSALLATSLRVSVDLSWISQDTVVMHANSDGYSAFFWFCGTFLVLRTSQSYGRFGEREVE